MSFWRDLRFATVVVLLLVVVVGGSFYRPLLVTGTAVDAEGKYVQSIVGGCLACASQRIRVRAEGFETETLNVSPTHPGENGDRVEVNRRLFGLWQRVTVILYQEQKVDHVSLVSSMTFQDGRAIEVLSVDPKLGQRRSPELLLQRLRQRTRSAETVPVYMMLDAAVDATGKVMALPGSETASGNARPESLNLNLVNQDGGFLLVPPMQGLPRQDRFRETLRRLRQAPKNGYQQSINLDPSLAHHGDVFFFYCRVGERYGKGRLTLPQFDPPGSRHGLRSHIKVLLNKGAGLTLPQG